MGTNIHVQLFGMFGFGVTNLVSIWAKDLGPRANKLMWDSRFDDLVASVCITVAFNVTVAKVMLSGDDISKNSGTKRTLVGNNKHVDMISKGVTRKFGSHLVMNKFAVGVTFVRTLDSFGHLDVAK